MIEKLLTARELAEYLRVNEYSVYRWVAQNKIPHLRVDRALRFNLQDVEAVMRERAMLKRQHADGAR